MINTSSAIELFRLFVKDVWSPRYNVNVCSLVQLHDPKRVEIDFRNVPYNRPVCPSAICMLLNSVEYSDEILHTHWYWQDLAHGIAKCHLPFDEALLRSKMRKIETGTISWSVWNILVKFGNTKLVYTLILTISIPWYWQMSNLSLDEAMPGSNF